MNLLPRFLTGTGAMLAVAFATWPASPIAASRSAPAGALEAYGRLPLSFEKNEGQAGERVKFLTRGSGYTLFLTSDEAVLNLPPSRQPPSPRRETEVVRMGLAGANQHALVEGVEPLAGRVNYLIGRDPRKWRTGVATYAKVRYQDIYPGIDLIYYGNQRQLEYDFVVAPGADPAVIRLAFDGAVSRLRIDDNGDLVLRSGGDQLRLLAPRVYQERDGVREPVAGAYMLLNTQVGFELAPYDTTRPLVIDPVLSYSHYLGGMNADFAADIALDADGNAYITGGTHSPDFPGADPLTFGGDRDVFVTKLNADGVLQYSTFIGGPGRDSGSGIVVEADHAYVSGSTTSGFGFPGATFAGSLGMSDAFVLKLNADGSGLDFATVVGGALDEQGNDVAVAAGQPVIVGSTASRNFPVDAFSPTKPAHFFAGMRDAFVTGFDSGGFIAFSTHLGGTNVDEGNGIAADAGDVLVTGQTCSGTVAGFPVSGTAFPTMNAYQTEHQGGCDAFVTKLSPSNGMLYSTYLGGGGSDRGRGIAVGSAGHVYVTGETTSSSTSFPIQMEFPITAGAFQTDHGGGVYDAFVTRLNTENPQAEQLVYSTYLGEAGDDYGSGVVVDYAHFAYVTGNTTSTLFPVVNPWPGGDSLDGGNTFGDAFVTKVRPSGAGLAYSAFLGGADDEIAGRIAVDGAGNAYVVGGTVSTNFPSPEGGIATPGFSGMGDGYVAKISVPCVPGGGPLAYTGAGTVIDTATDCVLPETVPGGLVIGIGSDVGPGFINPGAVAVRPDGAKVYGLEDDGTSSFVRVYDTATKLVTTMPVGVPNGPNGPGARAVAVTPDGMRLFVAVHEDIDNNQSHVYVFDTASDTLTHTIDLGISHNGDGLAVHPDGTRVYVSHYETHDVGVINTQTNVMPPSYITLNDMSVCNICPQAIAVAMTPDGQFAYVGNKNSEPVAVIDTDTNSVAYIPVGGTPSGLAVTPQPVFPYGYLVYVATGTSVDVIDTISKTVVSTVSDATGNAVAVTPDGTKVYVSADAYVGVIDAATNQVVDAIPAAGGRAVAIGPQDRDGDGIIDQLDGTVDVNNNFVPNFSFTDPSTFSNDFTDRHLGGISEGTIVDRAGLTVTVWDAFNSGFYASARNGPGQATVNACGDPDPVLLTHDDAVQLLCGSLTVKVLRGPVEVGLGIDGFAVIPTGGSVKISEPAPGQTVVDNQGPVAIAIVDPQGQQTATIAPGGSVTFGDVCACEGPSPGRTWKNHGEYVLCLTKAAEAQVGAGLITEKQKGQIVSAAAKSSCGGKKSPGYPRPRRSGPGR